MPYVPSSLHTFLRARGPAAVVIGMIAAVLAGCNTMRYVPDDQYLLRKNKVEFTEVDKELKRRERVKPSELAPYIQQRPNSRLLGMGIYLGFYNLTDTARHGGWQRFWREKVGEAPVIYDSTNTVHTGY